MGIVEFIALLIGLFILLFVVDKITNKILGVKTIKISETPGKSLERWGNTIIYLITLWFVIDGNSDIQRILFAMTEIALFLGYQAILGFIFIKESRQYISTTVLLIMVLVIMYIIHNYPFWN